MEIELRKERIHVNEAVCTETMQVLVESDVIVPDTKSDVSKVLQIDSSVTVDNIVIRDAGPEITGRVNMTVLYVPDGDAKPVSSMPVTLEYRALPENEKMTAGCKCAVNADICHVEFSMLNSRKLSVRAIVELDIKCFKESELETVCEMDGGVEAKRDHLQIYNLTHTSMSKFPVRETLSFPTGKPSASAVIKADTKLTDKEVRVLNGKVAVKGNIQICTLYVSEANMIEFMEHELPFTEVIDADGAHENCMCDLDLSLSGEEIALRADSDGDMRFLDVSILCSVNLALSEVADVSVITDCFCRDKNMVCTSDAFTVHMLAGTGSAQASVKGILQLGGNAPELAEVYNVVAKPYISEVEVSDNTATVQGVIHCYLLYLSASAASPVSTGKAQIDFSLPITVDGLREGMDCEISSEVSHCAYNITMTGEIEIRCVLNLTAKAIENKTLSLISGASVEDTPLDLRHGIILYFVKSGDTLWDIAKQYRVPVALLKSVNKLEDADALAVGQRLLIPNVQRTL